LGTIDDIVVTKYVTRPSGTNYKGWSRAHPLSPYYKAKETEHEWLPLHLQWSRVGYRQYLGVVLGANGLRVPARCVEDFFRRAQSFEGAEKRALLDCRLHASGYAMDNMKPLDFAEALMPLVVTGSAEGDEEINEVARRLIQAADIIAGQLGTAVRRALYGEKGNADRDSTALEPVRNRFWSDTERDFYSTLRTSAEKLVGPDGQVNEQKVEVKRTSAEAWRQGLRRCAFSIFDNTVPIEDAASDRIRDVIEGRKMLSMALEGYGSVGKKLYGELQLPQRETRAKNGRKA
jgi:CRISPR system Cascade subunit CasA